MNEEEDLRRLWRFALTNEPGRTICGGVSIYTLMQRHKENPRIDRSDLRDALRLGVNRNAMRLLLSHGCISGKDLDDVGALYTPNIHMSMDWDLALLFHEYGARYHYSHKDFIFLFFVHCCHSSNLTERQLFDYLLMYRKLFWEMLSLPTFYRDTKVQKYVGTAEKRWRRAQHAAVVILGLSKRANVKKYLNRDVLQMIAHHLIEPDMVVQWKRKKPTPQPTNPVLLVPLIFCAATIFFWTLRK